MREIGKKAAAAVMAGLMAVSAVAPASIAIAEEVQPSVGKPTDPNGNHQTGTGVTDVTVQYRQVGEDIGGTEDPNNPDGDPDDPSTQDGLGDNIAFTVPTAINFVADAQGKLTGPSASAAYIENESAFSIHASAFRTEAKDGWTIVDDDTTVTTTDAVDFQFGPSTSDKAPNADAFDYLATAPNKVKIASVNEDKNNVADWNMAPKASEGVADRVQLTTTGDIHNVSKDITQRTKMAEIHTFVTAGSAVSEDPSAALQEPLEAGRLRMVYNYKNNVNRESRLKWWPEDNMSFKKYSVPWIIPESWKDMVTGDWSLIKAVRLYARPASQASDTTYPAYSEGIDTNFNFGTVMGYVTNQDYTTTVDGQTVTIPAGTTWREFITRILLETDDIVGIEFANSVSAFS